MVRTPARGAQNPPVIAVGLVAAMAAALGVALLLVIPAADRLPAGGRAVPVLVVVVGWAFVAAGAIAWLRRPDNRMGVLLVVFGLVVLLTGFTVDDDALPYLVSTFADPLAIAVFAHLLLAFPSGRPEGRVARSVVAALYAVAVVPQVAIALSDPRLGDASCTTCPGNLLLVAEAPSLASALLALQRVAGLALVLAALALVARRRRATTGFAREAYAPVLGAGGTILAVGIASAVAQDIGLDPAIQRDAQLFFIATFVALPAAFLHGLTRARVFRTASVRRLLERLTTAAAADGSSGGVDGHPALTVAHWLPEPGTYVDRDGRPFTLPPPGGAVATTEIDHRGRRLGVLVHDAALADDPALMATATGAAALALENDRLEVELRARLEALRRSRARIVEAGDAERRRLGRDLHDGAQQRLISLLLDLQLARERWDAEPRAARALVDQALESARAAVGELRELAAGIHPAVLSQRGLDAALETLAARSAVPVELEILLQARLPAAVETAAYFVAAEALTNVVKHAGATHARVAVRREGGTAVVEIADDGAGGAALDGGTGVLGLADRVGALGGTLSLDSPRGGGTVLRARFPLG
jgi:signal transduction histidine kinase